MRILYFHQHFCTPEGAGGTRSYEMARALVQRGHEVTMVCGCYENHKTGLTGPSRRWIRQGTVDGIRVIEIRLRYSNYDGFIRRGSVFTLFALRSIYLAWRIKYDVLFATSTPLTAGLPGIVMRRVAKPRKPFVFEVRDLWPELPREMGVLKSRTMLGLLSCLEWLSYNSADGCIGLSPGIVKGIRRRCSADKPVDMIPNGCDLQVFQPGSGSQSPEGGLSRRSRGEDGRAEVGGQQKGMFRAVFTGAHGMANGLHAVLDAAGELKQRGREDISLEFIGDGKFKPGLRARAEQEQLSNCRFTDPLAKTVLAKRSASEFDVGLMVLANVPAFYYGTSPNKFFDYIAGGLPVLNNYPGWLADMIREYNCGIVVPPEDPGAFADALEHLADHPDECREMGRNARRLAEERFGRHQLGEKLVDFLETLHQRHGAK